MTRAFLTAACVVVLASWALAPLTQVVAHFAAYLLAAVVAMCLVAVSRRFGLQEAAKTGLPVSGSELIAMRLIVMAAFLAGLFHSYYIARHLA